MFVIQGMTIIQQKIFNKILKEWGKRVSIENVDEETLIKIIKFADVHEDGKKRVSLLGDNKVHLVPIEDIILNGLRGTEIEKYPIEKKRKIKKVCKNCKHFEQSTYLGNAGWCDLETCKRVYHSETCNKFEGENR